MAAIGLHLERFFHNEESDKNRLPGSIITSFLDENSQMNFWKASKVFHQFISHELQIPEVLKPRMLEPLGFIAKQPISHFQQLVKQGAPNQRNVASIVVSFLNGLELLNCIKISKLLLHFIKGEITSSKIPKKRIYEHKLFVAILNFQKKENAELICQLPPGEEQAVTQFYQKYIAARDELFRLKTTRTMIFEKAQIFTLAEFDLLQDTFSHFIFFKRIEKGFKDFYETPLEMAEAIKKTHQILKAASTDKRELTKKDKAEKEVPLLAQCIADAMYKFLWKEAFKLTGIRDPNHRNSIYTHMHDLQIKLRISCFQLLAPFLKERKFIAMSQYFDSKEKCAALTKLWFKFYYPTNRGFIGKKLSYLSAEFQHACALDQQEVLRLRNMQRQAQSANQESSKEQLRRLNAELQQEIDESDVLANGTCCIIS